MHDELDPVAHRDPDFEHPDAVVDADQHQASVVMSPTASSTSVLSYTAMNRSCPPVASMNRSNVVSRRLSQRSILETSPCAMPNSSASWV